MIEKLALIVIGTLLMPTVGLLGAPPASASGNAAASAQGSGYARWPNGPSPDPSYFPLAVWLQDPKKAKDYQALGINLYVGLWEGPTERQLQLLRQAGMQVICDQNEVGLQHVGDSTIVAWLQGDEPDNAQPLPEGGYGPAIPPERIAATYEQMRRSDPTRPVLLNLGQGVANDEWVGIGCDRSAYPEYVKACDIVSFDIYPVVGIRKPDGENYLWYVAKGLDRLRDWSGGAKVIWNALECTRISNPDKKATPHQVRAEVWMSLIHGSRGIIYFVHQFEPTFVEAALLADPEMSQAVKAINEQILSLAPVLNSPSVPDIATVESADPAVPMDVMVKREADATYLFVVGMRNAPTHGAFQVTGLGPTAAAEVLGEARTLPVVNGRFEDDFQPYDVHLYRITTQPGADSADD